LSYQPAVDDRYEFITHTLMDSSGEVHVFWHSSPQPVFLHLGGYGIGAPDSTSIHVKQTDDRLELRTPDYHSILRVYRAPTGLLTHDVLTPRPGWKQAHLFDSVGTFPTWRSAAPVPANTPTVIYVDGGRSRAPHQPNIRVELAPGKLTVHFDGHAHVIDLPW